MITFILFSSEIPEVDLFRAETMIFRFIFFFCFFSKFVFFSHFKLVIDYDKSRLKIVILKVYFLITTL